MATNLFFCCSYRCRLLGLIASALFEFCSAVFSYGVSHGSRAMSVARRAAAPPYLYLGVGVARKILGQVTYLPDGDRDTSRSKGLLVGIDGFWRRKQVDMDYICLIQRWTDFDILSDSSWGKKKTYSCGMAASVLHFASCPTSATYAARITGAPHARIQRLEMCNLYSLCPGSFGRSMEQIMSSPLPAFSLPLFLESCSPEAKVACLAQQASRVNNLFYGKRDGRKGSSRSGNGGGSGNCGSIN
ncbi:hypothetical protein BDA99DRAFT_534200 [Phascolomyces articulosus]|uniref:Uncharacterized protein n=1 Tax=Phascolomyces articulosus TaxID=60185 RepID=A0AAD5PH30_9FUNG|nr:hypothetical protein BDA99DRAFT_534200 [Phascolomyces articulosus]